MVFELDNEATTDGTMTVMRTATSTNTIARTLVLCIFLNNCFYYYTTSGHIFPFPSLLTRNNCINGSFSTIFCAKLGEELIFKY